MMLKSKSYEEFYRVSCCDTMHIDGHSKSNMMDCIWHVHFQKSIFLDPFMDIETFRYELDSSYLQQSELDLWRRLALINDKVSLVLRNGELIKIDNIDFIQKRAKKICEEVSMIYKGDEITMLLQGIKNIYSDTNLLMRQYAQINLFGTLLSPWTPYNGFEKRAIPVFLNIPGHDIQMQTYVECIPQQNDNLIELDAIIFHTIVHHDKSIKSKFDIQEHCGTIVCNNKDGSLLSSHLKFEYISDIGVQVIRECKIKQLNEDDLIYL